MCVKNYIGWRGGGGLCVSCVLCPFRVAGWSFCLSSSTPCVLSVSVGFVCVVYGLSLSLDQERDRGRAG